MIILLSIIGITTWLYIGYKGFVYWWTKDFDFTSADLGSAYILSLLGPFIWIVGKLILYGGDSFKIIKRKRN